MSLIKSVYNVLSMGSKTSFRMMSKIIQTPEVCPNTMCPFKNSIRPSGYYDCIICQQKVFIFNNNNSSENNINNNNDSTEYTPKPIQNEIRM